MNDSDIIGLLTTAALFCLLMEVRFRRRLHCNPRPLRPGAVCLFVPDSPSISYRGHVAIVRRLDAGTEVDEDECGRMYRVRTPVGNEYDAFENELSIIVGG